MGIRFRKRVKIMPGVSLNISKSGISTTIGTKGASVNIGKNGVYGNAGIPGTGIYTREKIIGNKRKGKQASNTSLITSGKGIDAPYSANDCTYQYASQVNENSDLFSFGCLVIVCGVIIGAFFGWAFGNIGLAFIISPILIVLIFVQRYANLNKEPHEGNSSEIEVRKQAMTNKNSVQTQPDTERVLLDELLVFGALIEKDTFMQLLDFKIDGAEYVNVPYGTLKELKRRKNRSSTQNEQTNAEKEFEHIEYDNINSYKKEALYAELQKNYEKANYYWHRYLQKMFDSDCDLDTEAVEKAIYCIRKSPDLMPELYLYYDLIRHYPNHPCATKWESERDELEKIINTQ